MKTLLTKLSLLSLVLMMGLASCTEETTDPGGDNNGVTKLSANARSSTAINVRWEGGSATDTLVATADGAEMKYTAVTTETIVGTTYHKAVATGLQLNKNYVFTVRNASGKSAGSLTWATATRWPSESNTSQSVQVWSTADPSPAHPSGLIIDGTGITAVSTNGAQKDAVDIVLGFNADVNTPVSILSPGIDGSGIITTKRTFFGMPYNVAGGLDNDYYDAPINALISTTGSTAFNSVDLTRRAAGNEALGTSLIIPFLTDDNYYGRIELVPNASTGQIFTTESAIESVQIKVSYQTQLGSGYVGRGTVRNPNPRTGVSTANSIMKR